MSNHIKIIGTSKISGEIIGHIMKRDIICTKIYTMYQPKIGEKNMDKTNGYGSKLKTWETTDIVNSEYSPSNYFRYPILTHTHIMMGSRYGESLDCHDMGNHWRKSWEYH